jgi:uncharacterized protein
MAIGKLTETSFVAILEAHLRPSRPVDTTELLFGREAALDRMQEAFSSAGRQVFIYGDRGVGKTSVAKTAGFVLNPADSEPVYVIAGPGTSFQSLMKDIFRRLVEPDKHEITKRVKSVSADMKVVKAQSTVESTSGGIPDMPDVNSAIFALQSACGSRQSRRVVIIDEFDQLESEIDKQLFAQLIKQLGDQDVHACFIFVGIGRSIDGLLRGHESCYRYIESVQLDRLNFSGRWEIIDKCSQALGVTVNQDSRFRIAQISDGFPHYVHLVGQKLFWSAFRDEYLVTEIEPRHYIDAVRSAVLSVEAHLKQQYEVATKKYKDEYEEVLWAVADHYELARNTEAIFGSYRRVMDLRYKEPMKRRTLSIRLNALKSDMCGQILVSPQRSWFEFRDSMERGYVRLRAEDVGVRLAIEHESAIDPPRPRGRPQQLKLPKN